MPENSSPSKLQLSRFKDDLRNDQELRAQSYRERALKLFPWVCARCGREFSGRKLRELTVHHKDHNHNYNPPDGSNWELLCLYCHEYEHTKLSQSEGRAPLSAGSSRQATATFKPFAGLAEILKK